MGNTLARPGAVEADPVERLEARVAQLEARVAAAFHMAGRLRSEIQRVDYLLAKAEGVLDMLDEFHAARQTPEYRAAFLIPNPLVTVTVATMNRPDLLIDRCLKSLLAQTHRNLQILVVGDHCTDDTEQRVAALGDPRIQFHNLPVRGPYPPPGGGRWSVAGTSAVNYALPRAEGYFVAHLDEDDRAVPERIATLVAAAQKHQADLCFHKWHDQRAGEGTWHVLGSSAFEYGQVTTGSIFYHRWLARIPWDVMAYRLGEPGDWNRLRKIRLLRPRLHFVDVPLIYKHKDPPRPFERQKGEEFLID